MLDEGESLLRQLKADPENTKLRLRLAETYQRNGEKEKSTAEYLKTADIFAKRGFYPQAMALYKQILRQNPVADEAGVKVADIYRRMGFLGDALAQYNLLLTQYDRLGLKQKTQEILNLIKEMEPAKDRPIITPEASAPAAPSSGSFGGSRRGVSPAKRDEFFFDLGAELEKSEPLEVQSGKEVSTEKFSGFRDILTELKDSGAPSKVYPDFNYRMGMACHEMGFIEEAVEQLRMAVERNQSPFEAACLLGICYKEKHWWQEASDSFQQALGMDGVSAEQRLKVKKELEFVSAEQKKMEETLVLGERKSSNQPEWRGEKGRRNKSPESAGDDQE